MSLPLDVEEKVGKNPHGLEPPEFPPPQPSPPLPPLPSIHLNAYNKNLV